jgi:type IV pilus assembly protein PilE
MRHHKGFTLIEVLVTLAVIAVISAIAIPAYNGYIREARLATARMNAESLRVFLEDYQLDNGTYVVGGDSNYDEAELQTNFGWSPDGDGDAFTYSVDVTATDWDIVVTHLDGDWIRCEDRMSNCCDSETSGASKSACP